VSDCNSLIVIQIEIEARHPEESNKKQAIGQVIWNAPLQNGFFVERPSLNKQLETMIKAAQEMNSFQVVVMACHGLGGVGKTQLALHYLYSSGDRYELLRGWMNCEDPEEVILQFFRLGQKMGIVSQTENYSKERAKHVKDWLEDQTRWLLVFDNVESEEYIKVCYI